MERVCSRTYDNSFLSIPSAQSQELVTCKFWRCIIYIGACGVSACNFLTSFLRLSLDPQFCWFPYRCIWSVAPPMAYCSAPWRSFKRQRKWKRNSTLELITFRTNYVTLKRTFSPWCVTCTKSPVESRPTGTFHWSKNVYSVCLFMITSN